ncbi:MAG: hypothetical protein N2450_09395 [bacterium]|nr:hypothetical protein [bacterium]
MKLSISPKLLFTFLILIYGCNQSDPDQPKPLYPHLQSERFVNNALYPSISPLGTTVIFQRGNSIYALLQNQEILLLSTNDPFPTSDIRWLNENEFVFSTSHVIGSLRNGLFHYSLSLRQLRQLHPSGRDPYPLQLNQTQFLIYEETNSNIGSGLFLYDLNQDTIFYTGVVGTKPCVSPNHQYLSYFSGLNGNLASVIFLPNFSNSIVMHSTDAFHIAFYGVANVIFDAFENSQNQSGTIHLYQYNLITNTKTVWFENGTEPISVNNNYLTFRLGSGTTSDVVQHRNGNFYLVGNQVGKFTLFPNGRVLFEKENDLWISE